MVVFPFFPLITDLDVVKQGGPYTNGTPTRSACRARPPLRHGRRHPLVQGAAASAGHMMNAVHEGSKVHLDLCLYDGNCFPFFTTPAGETTSPVPPILTRLTFDLEANDDGFTKAPLLRVPCEMPKTDDRYQGRPYRYGFMIVYRSADGSSAIGRVDHQTGELDVWGARPRRFRPGMPVRPPHPGFARGRRLADPSGLARVEEPQRSRGAGRPEPRCRSGGFAQAAGEGPLDLPRTWVPAQALASGRYDYALSDAA